MDVQNALNQINAAADCAEPTYAEIDLFEPHSMLMKVQFLFTPVY